MSAAVASPTVMSVGTAGVPSVGRGEARKRPRDGEQAATSDGADMSHTAPDDAARRVRARVASGDSEGGATSPPRQGGAARSRGARVRRASSLARHARATSPEHDHSTTRGTPPTKPQAAPTSERRATAGRGRRKGMPRRSGPGLTSCLLHPDRGLQAGGVRNHLRPSLIVDEAAPPPGVGLGMCHACFMWSLRHYGLDRQPHLRCYRRHDGVQVVAAKCRVKLQSLRRVGIIMRDMDGPCRCPRCDSENTYSQHPGLAAPPTPISTAPANRGRGDSSGKAAAQPGPTNGAPATATEQSAAAALLQVGMMPPASSREGTSVVKVQRMPQGPHATHTRVPHAVMGAMPPHAADGRVLEGDARGDHRGADSGAEHPGVSVMRHIAVPGSDGRRMMHHSGMHPASAGMQQYSSGPGPMSQGGPAIATMHVMHDYGHHGGPPGPHMMQYADHRVMMGPPFAYGGAMYAQPMYGHPGMRLVQGPPGAYMHPGPMSVVYGPPPGIQEQHGSHGSMHGHHGPQAVHPHAVHHHMVHHHPGPMQAPNSGGRAPPTQG